MIEQNADEKLSIASVTKVMTMLVVYEAIESNIIKKTDIITASAHATSMGGTQIYLQVGEQMKFEDMFKAMVIASANDCAVALAEACYGSEEAFVGKMNEKASALGCQNTLFSDCTGLNNENHYSSARDIAIISSELIMKFPEVLNLTSVYDDYVRTDTDDPFWLVNTNKLIGKKVGVDGLKTGWTEKAKYCLSATGSKNNMRLISVILGSESANKRNDDTLKLLNYGFANYENKLVRKQGEILSSVNSILYKPTSFHYVLSEDIYILSKKGAQHLITYHYTEENGQKYVEVLKDNEVIKKVPIITNVEVKKANFFETLLNIIKIYV